MNLYEAIFSRKSIRKYRQIPLDQETLSKIGAFYEDAPSLFPGIRTEIGITDNLDGKHAPRGFLTVKAPYYLTIYSEEKGRYEMNAGCVMEQLSLYMTTLGIGSCFLGSAHLPKDQQKREDMVFVMIMAFGYPEGNLRRRAAEARRLPMKELVSFREEPKRYVLDLLEAARLAPSSMNSQPWRIYAAGSRLHIFKRKRHFGKGGALEEFDFGILFAHLMIAADELWLDMDLIRLEDITHRNMKVSEYVLSAVINAV